jgi:urease accessory protein
LPSRRAPRLGIAAAVVSVFAMCHGYVHGLELPEAADPRAYGVGFVLVTGLLHAFGIAIGVLQKWPSGRPVLRGLGVVIGAIGVLVAGHVR